MRAAGVMCLYVILECGLRVVSLPQLLPSQFEQLLQGHGGCNQRPLLRRKQDLSRIWRMASWSNRADDSQGITVTNTSTTSTRRSWDLL
jgi:hypothetical protein